MSKMRSKNSMAEITLLLTERWGSLKEASVKATVDEVSFLLGGPDEFYDSLIDERMPEPCLKTFLLEVHPQRLALRGARRVEEAIQHWGEAMLEQLNDIRKNTLPQDHRLGRRE